MRAPSVVLISMEKVHQSASYYAYTVSFGACVMCATNVLWQ